MKKDFKGIDCGEKKINLRKHKQIIIMKPIEIYHKSNGTITNEPSFAIISTHAPSNVQVASEISLKMLNEGLADVGYKIEKI